MERARDRIEGERWPINEIRDACYAVRLQQQVGQPLDQESLNMVREQIRLYGGLEALKRLDKQENEGHHQLIAEIDMDWSWVEENPSSTS